MNDGRRAYLPTYSSILNALSTIVRTESYQGLYKGVGPAMVGSALSWGLYFLFYERAKAFHREWEPTSAWSPFAINSLAAWEGGSLTVLFTNPFWLIKTRMQLQISDKDMQARGQRPYRGLLGAFRARATRQTHSSASRARKDFADSTAARCRRCC